MPMTNFSIIIPTYHEVNNIPQLITRIANINFTPMVIGSRYVPGGSIEEKWPRNYG